MTTFTFTDNETNESIVFDGVWSSKPRAGSNDEPFDVDKGKMHLFQLPLMIDKGITHAVGSEAAAKFNAAKDKGKAVDADRMRIVREAREEWRQKLYDGVWGTGMRSVSIPAASRAAVLAYRDAMKEVSRLLKGQSNPFAKDGEHWVDPATNERLTVKDITDRYLASEAVATDDEGNETTMGAIRTARHNAVGEAEYQNELRRAADTAATRKVVGTSF